MAEQGPKNPKLPKNPDTPNPQLMKPAAMKDIVGSDSSPNRIVIVKRESAPTPKRP